MTKRDLIAMLEPFGNDTEVITPRDTAPKLDLVMTESGKTKVMLSSDPRDATKPVVRLRWQTRILR